MLSCLEKEAPLSVNSSILTKSKNLSNEKEVLQRAIQETLLEINEKVKSPENIQNNITEIIVLSYQLQAEIERLEKIWKSK